MFLMSKAYFHIEGDYCHVFFILYHKTSTLKMIIGYIINNRTVLFSQSDININERRHNCLLWTTFNSYCNLVHTRG